MGMLDSFRKGGGGFLNQVDGLITNIGFTTNPDFGGKGTAKKASDKSGSKLWAALTVLIDGDEKGAQTTHIDAGGADDFVISEDGRSLTPVTPGAKLWGGTDFLKLYESMVSDPGGVEDVDVPEDGTLNFDHLIGVRARFVQVKNEDAMKRAAKDFKANKGKAREFHNELGQKKGKDGKFYDIRALQVSEVYSTGNDVGATPAKGKKIGVKPIPKGKPVVAKTDDISAFAEATLLGILADADLPKDKLNITITRKLASDKRREPVRTFLADDANLVALVDKGVITYDEGVLAAV